MPSGSLGILTPLLIRKQKEMDELCCMTEWESDDALESGTRGRATPTEHKKEQDFHRHSDNKKKTKTSFWMTQ